MRSFLVFLLVPSIAAAESPADAIALAHRDCMRQPATIRRSTRYLSLYYANTKVETDIARKVLDFHCNNLSKAPEIVRLRSVTGSSGSLLALVLDDYEWPKELWEKLAESDPYFHVLVREASSTEKGETPTAPGPPAPTRPALAPWLIETTQQKQALTELVAATGSQVPVVRGDWFVWQTGIQADRGDTGYYGWLGIKDQASFYQLIGFDPETLKRFPKELREAVSDSGVARQPRRIERFGTIGGGLWRTSDVIEAKGEKNPLRLLNGGFKADAHEEFAHLPNGLFAFLLIDKDGKRQDSAPDFVGPDQTTHSNDGRIHIGLSCVRCHGKSAGINDIEGWARGIFKDKITLQSPDYDTLKKLRRLYLGDLEQAIEDDRRIYRRAVKACNEWGVEQNAQAYTDFWAAYEFPVTAERAAHELGVSKEQVLAALDSEIKRTGGIDTLLVGLLQQKGIPIQAFQESLGQAHAMVKRYKVANSIGLSLR